MSARTLVKALVLLLMFALALVQVGAFAAPPAQVEVLIGFKQTPGQEELAVVHGAGGRIKHTYHLIPAVAASVPETALNGLRNNPHVQLVEMDGTVQATDAELDNAWGVKHVGAGNAHASGLTGAGVKVAVIDSGIDYTHPDLNDNYAGGYDFVNGDSDPRDDNNHGTHVAGTIAAEDNGSGVVGVAPGARLYALKVLNSSGSGSWSNIIAALQWAADNGIQVTNNSYGSSSNPGTLVQQAFDNSAAAGVVHIAAAGNSGTRSGTGDRVEYPGRYGSVVAVAATDQSDLRASFSSTGPDVELAAPGVSIRSTAPGGGYASYNGTSMASPHVAGVAALLVSSGASDVRQTLRNTATDLGAAGRDAYYGFGLVQVTVTASTPTTVGALSGTVTDAGTGTPISGATVQADSGQSTTTAGDGTYTLSNVPTGSRSVTASAGGYASAAQAVSVTEGATSAADFALTMSVTADTASVASISYATNGGKGGAKNLTVSITAADNLGNPVSGATVSIQLRNTTRGQTWTGSATTSSAGSVTFSLSNAPSGCYTTTVTALSASGLAWDGVTPSNGYCK